MLYENGAYFDTFRNVKVNSPSFLHVHLKSWSLKSQLRSDASYFYSFSLNALLSRSGMFCFYTLLKNLNWHWKGSMSNLGKVSRSSGLLWIECCNLIFLTLLVKALTLVASSCNSESHYTGEGSLYVQTHTHTHKMPFLFVQFYQYWQFPSWKG